MLDQAVGHTYIFAETLAPSQRMHMVLLGVNDVAKAARFYEALGWQRSPTSSDGFVKFNMGGYAICLINRSDLAKDALEPTAENKGFSGVALIHVARKPEAAAHPGASRKRAARDRQTRHLHPLGHRRLLAGSRWPPVRGRLRRRLGARPGQPPVVDRIN
jgi:hypothetical protein